MLSSNEEIRRERDDVSNEDLEKAERQVSHHDKCAASLSALVEENGIAAVLSILGAVCRSRQESMPTHWALTRHAWSVVRKRLADLSVYANKNC